MPLGRAQDSQEWEEEKELFKYLRPTFSRLLRIAKRQNKALKYLEAALEEREEKDMGHLLFEIRVALHYSGEPEDILS